MTKLQLISDMTEEDDANFQLAEEDFVEKTECCKHPQIKFLYAGQGKYDIYVCAFCKETIVKPWQN